MKYEKIKGKIFKGKSEIFSKINQLKRQKLRLVYVLLKTFITDSSFDRLPSKNRGHLQQNQTRKRAEKRAFCYECHLKFKLVINFSKLMKNAIQSNERKMWKHANAVETPKKKKTFSAKLHMN